MNNTTYNELKRIATVIASTISSADDYEREINKLNEEDENERILKELITKSTKEEYIYDYNRREYEKDKKELNISAYTPKKSIFKKFINRIGRK